MRAVQHPDVKRRRNFVALSCTLLAFPRFREKGGHAKVVDGSWRAFSFRRSKLGARLYGPIVRRASSAQNQTKRTQRARGGKRSKNKSWAHAAEAVVVTETRATLSWMRIHASLTRMLPFGERDADIEKRREREWERESEGRERDVDIGMYVRVFTLWFGWRAQR